MTREGAALPSHVSVRRDAHGAGTRAREGQGERPRASTGQTRGLLSTEGARTTIDCAVALLERPGPRPRGIRGRVPTCAITQLVVLYPNVYASKAKDVRRT